MDRKLQKINLLSDKISAQWEIPGNILAKWNPEVYAAGDSPDTITINEQIGQSWDGSGMTASRMAGLLNKMGGKDINVSINSPGGDIFDGISIYNQLLDYAGSVTVKITGLAASAASIIAMAGDNIQIARSAFLMIHNSWSVVMGNKEELIKAADVLSQIDSAMTDVYAEKTGIDSKKISKMMGADTWLSGQDAVDQGFADAVFNAGNSESKQGKKTSAESIRRIEAALAKEGYSRAKRRELIGEILSVDVSAENMGDVSPVVVKNDDFIESLKELNQTLKGY